MRSDHIPYWIKFICRDVIYLGSWKSLILLPSISFQSAVKNFMCYHYIIDDKQSTGKVVPVHTMKAYGVSEGTFSVLNLGCRRRWMVTFMAGHFTVSASWLGDWVSPRASLGFLEKTRIRSFFLVIGPQYLDCPAYSTVTVLTLLFWLHTQ